jgi:hypothetical protein
MVLYSVYKGYYYYKSPCGTLHDPVFVIFRRSDIVTCRVERLMGDYSLLDPIMFTSLAREVDMFTSLALKVYNVHITCT